MLRNTSRLQYLFPSADLKQVQGHWSHSPAVAVIESGGFRVLSSAPFLYSWKSEYVHSPAFKIWPQNSALTTRVEVQCSGLELAHPKQGFVPSLCSLLEPSDIAAAYALVTP